MFRPFEETRVPSYIIQDDYADMPYEMFTKDMEIPEIAMKLREEGLEYCELHIVPERLKRRVVLDKRYNLREKVGTISIDLPEKVADNEEDFDEDEQMYFQRESQCKYRYMYGTPDMRELSVLQLSGASSDGTKRLLIEVPDFRNFLLYNLLAAKLVDVFKPSKVVLFVEETESTSAVSSSSAKSQLLLDDILSGTFRGPGGELGLCGITASFLNVFPLSSVSFSVVERNLDAVKTLYL